MRKFIYKASLLALTVLILPIISCSKDGDDDLLNNGKEGLNYPFTIEEGNSEWRFEVNGKEYKGSTGWVNSLNSNKFLSIYFDGSFPYGGISWVPYQAGTYKSGQDLGEGSGSVTGKLYFTSSVNVDGEKYYSHSHNEYGDVEEDIIPGTSSTYTIKKFEGGFKQVKTFYGTYRMFIGEVSGLFEGTFKTADGSKSVEVTKGEFRLVSKLNSGDEIVE